MLLLSTFGPSRRGDAVRVFEAPEGTDVAGILARIATMVPPAFQAVTWETTYLP